MRVSIVIPALNAASFISDAIDSCLAQTAGTFAFDLEILVVDNGSTDDTRAVVENAARATPVRYHRNHSNLGPAKNIVRGPAALATGEYAWVLGHHNLVAPGALRRVTAALREHAATDVFYVNFRCARFPEQWPVDYLQVHLAPQKGPER